VMSVGMIRRRFIVPEQVLMSPLTAAYRPAPQLLNPNSVQSHNW
jgi:hypothetical protein